jgi:3-hydroxyisobutyrate dehydrogenase-like beta-hydroxyacid dehydrogenase
VAKLGFLGLGIMGYPMARNLLRAGHEVALWSHNAAKARQLAEEEKGLCCETPRQVAELADCVFLCVGNTAMSEEAILGKDGLAAGGRPNGVIADTSTVSPSRSRAMGRSLAERDMHLLDAPCTGSKPGAEQGALTFMVGGPKDVFARVRPWFEPMGKQLYYCGGPGMGLSAKLAQNLILSNMMQAFNEAFVLATKAGVDPRLLLEIVNNSAARSGLVAFKAPYVLSRNFSTNFSVKWMHKDIELMMEAGRELNVPLRLTAVTERMFQEALDAGLGDEDICSTIKVLERTVGVEVKRPQGD